jgi:hypothetical protein
VEDNVAEFFFRQTLRRGGADKTCSDNGDFHGKGLLEGKYFAESVISGQGDFRQPAPKRQLRSQKSLNLRIELLRQAVTIPHFSMKLTLPSQALAAILGLALAGAPLTTHAQTTSTTTSTTSMTSTTSTPTAPKPKMTRGLVTAVDAAGSTISVENKTDGTRTFSIASTIKITKDKKPATLADFAVGDKVYITYTTDASGTLTATKLSGKTMPAASTASSSAPMASTTNSSAPAATTTTSSAPATTTSN